MNRDWSRDICHAKVTAGELLEQTARIMDQLEVTRFYREAEKIPVILYGAGTYGKMILESFRVQGVPVAAVCDTKLCGQNVPGIGPVLSFQEAAARFPTHQVLIASRDYEDEIREMILSMEPNCKLWPSGSFPLWVSEGYEVPKPEVYRAFLEAHTEEVDALLSVLADDESRISLASVLYSRLTWDLSGVKNVCVRDDYFPDGVVSLSQNEVFFDGGAYTGDTLAQLIKQTNGKFDKAVCFEPGPTQGNELARTFEKELASGQVELIRKGLSDQETTVGFQTPEHPGGCRIVTQGGDIQIQTTTIDAVAAERGLRPTFIKMDIEGFELAALHGAEKTIRTCKPKLGICVYHKMEDMITIPQYILSLNPDYRLYIRHHVSALGPDLEETALYAIP